MNLRALLGAAIPVIVGYAYAFSQRNNYPAGLPYVVIALLGAVIPEFLMQLTPDQELGLVMKESEKRTS